jgi:predicted transcriptional regulator YdeE
MSYAKVRLEERFLIGKHIRTVNAAGKAEADIGTLWQAWFVEGGVEQIKNRLSDDTVNMYYDYESDHNSPYSVLLGCFVSNLDNVPDGFSAICIPEMDFVKYELVGKLPDIVVRNWSEIYKETRYIRAFGFDYDLYPAGQENPHNMCVETYVSIK